MPKEKNQPVSYTESELKAELLKRRAEQARIDALRKPPSRGQAKADNFWYHYKWHTIAGAVALCLVVFFVRDVVFRTKPDATIELITGGYVSTEVIEALQAALEERAPDQNGDGKVSIAVDSIQLGVAAAPPEAAAEPPGADVEAGFAAPMGAGETEYASIMKFSAVLAANADPVYLVDGAAYDYIRRMSTDDDGTVDPVFAPQQGTPAAEDDRLSLSATSLADIPGLEALGDLTFCIRFDVKTDEKDAAYYDYCAELLKSLAS